MALWRVAETKKARGRKGLVKLERLPWSLLFEQYPDQMQFTKEQKPSRYALLRRDWEKAYARRQ